MFICLLGCPTRWTVYLDEEFSVAISAAVSYVRNFQFEGLYTVPSDLPKLVVIGYRMTS